MGTEHAHKPRASKSGAHDDHASAPKPKTAAEMTNAHYAAVGVVGAIEAIFKGGRGQDGVDPMWWPALELLREGVQDQRTSSSASRLEQIDAGMAALGPPMDPLRATEDGRFYMSRVTDKLVALRCQLEANVPRERVQNTTKVGDQYVEVDDTAPARQQAHVLSILIPEVQKRLLEVRALIQAHPELSRSELAALTISVGDTTLSLMDGPESLGQVLGVAGGLLELGDLDLVHELREADGVFAKVATISGLVHTVSELVGEGTKLTVTAVGAIAKKLGKAALGERCAGVVEHLGKGVGGCLGALNFVTGVFDMLGAKSAQDVIDGGVKAAGGAGEFLAARYGAEVLGAATGAIELGWEELKLAMELLGATELGINAGLMSRALRTLGRDGILVADAAESLVKARWLIDNERDPARKAGLERTVPSLKAALRTAIEGLRADCQPHAFSVDNTMLPGGYAPFVKALAPLTTLDLGDDEVERSAARVAVILDGVREHFADLVGQSIE